MLQTCAAVHRFLFSTCWYFIFDACKCLFKGNASNAFKQLAFLKLLLTSLWSSYTHRHCAVNKLPQHVGQIHVHENRTVFFSMHACGHKKLSHNCAWASCGVVFSGKADYLEKLTNVDRGIAASHHAGHVVWRQRRRWFRCHPLVGARGWRSRHDQLLLLHVLRLAFQLDQAGKLVQLDVAKFFTFLQHRWLTTVHALCCHNPNPKKHSFTWQSLWMTLYRWLLQLTQGTTNEHNRKINLESLVLNDDSSVLFSGKCRNT